ncbi:unnamed protein product, partial [Mesorhabditis spiculigera]
MDDSAKSQLKSIPLLKTKAGPRDEALWPKRLQEELEALIAFVTMNKENDKDWFHIECSDRGDRWYGKCWTFYNNVKYEFAVEFDIPITYPTTGPEIALPELDGKTAKISPEDEEADGDDNFRAKKRAETGKNSAEKNEVTAPTGPQKDAPPTVGRLMPTPPNLVPPRVLARLGATVPGSGRGFAARPRNGGQRLVKDVDEPSDPVRIQAHQQLTGGAWNLPLEPITPGNGTQQQPLLPRPPHIPIR